jgi:hypothetical protein
MRCRRAPRTEQGLTLIELLVTVTLTGIIGFVICQAFLLTLKLGPEARERTKVAADSSLLIDRLSDDVANARVVTAGSVNAKCVIQDAPLWTFDFGDGTSAAWSVKIAASSTANVNTYVISRLSGAPTAQAMLTGYCNASSGADVTKAVVSEPTYSLDITIRSSATSAERVISFRGDRRTLTPPP